jgi:hypothetical protein
VRARSRIEAALAPELVDAIEALVAERVAEALPERSSSESNSARWLTLAQAAERLGCSPRGAHADQARPARASAPGREAVRERSKH